MNSTHRVRVGQLPDIARLCLRQVHGGKKPKTPVGFQGPAGHGENIWVFAHRRTQQIIYSFEDQLDGFHSLKQLPFNGKKSKPAKLRKDYWSPMAHIALPAGAGAAGRTVYQKLRELKHLHEVSWDDAVLFRSGDELTVEERVRAQKRAAEDEKSGRDPREYKVLRTKAQRAKALNAQKPNAVADMAAVLGGAGPGNKMNVPVEGQEGVTELMEVVVSWARDEDIHYAESWSSNVTHTALKDRFKGFRQPTPKPEPVEEQIENEATPA